MKLRLKSVEEEAADCRAAFQGVPVGALALHVHHGVLVEPLIEPAENRIRYILEAKPQDEKALRLRLFRPIPPEYITPELVRARAELARAREEWVKAVVDLARAREEWVKAGAEWAKAEAEWVKAGAERDKAEAERDKAREEWVKAEAERDKARAEWVKAGAERAKASTERDKSREEWAKAGHHSVLCPNCPWDGRTIFP
jgi:hypothetical protein